MNNTSKIISETRQAFLQTSQEIFAKSGLSPFLLEGMIYELLANVKEMKLLQTQAESEAQTKEVKHG